MAKITAMLEKYNWIEKVDKKKSKDTILSNENIKESGEVLNTENNVVKAEDNDYEEVIEEETKGDEEVIKEGCFEMESNIEYDKKMLANEIYCLYGLENNNTNTVFMLESLINALPQNLPQDVIKQSVINIINASNINLDKLLCDGQQRLEILVNLMEGYYNETNKSISDYKTEIERLSGLINNCEKQIKIKETILEDQTYIVKYETEKIDGIMQFFAKQD